MANTTTAALTKTSDAIACEKVLERLAEHGFGIYAVTSGKFNAEAKFAIADPYDDVDGFYMEGNDLLSIASEAAVHLLNH